MKILHIETGRHLYGGARQVQYIIEGLAAHGVNNILVCPRQSAIAKAIPASVAQIVEVSVAGEFDLRLGWQIWKTIRATRPDLVHVHSRRGADLWGALTARLTHTPCVLSRRVDNPEPRWLMRLKYRLYDHVITISEAIRRVLLAGGLPPHKVSCVRSAVAPETGLPQATRDQLHREFGLPSDSVVIGCIAQLIPRKGHRHLLAAIPAILQAFPCSQVLLFGRGPLEADLKTMVQAAGLDNVVHFVGFRDDLTRWLSALDIVVHPAEMEGLGVSLLQAAAAGVPIVATRAGGIPEIVRDSENGILVPPGDVPALTTTLLQLLGDPAARARLGADGRVLAQTEFSAETMVIGNLAVYERVLKARASHR